MRLLLTLLLLSLFMLVLRLLLTMIVLSLLLSLFMLLLTLLLLMLLWLRHLAYVFGFEPLA
jgi:hypothetical protein